MRVSNFLLILSLASQFSCGQDEVNVPVELIEVQGDYITDGLSTQMSARVFPENATNQEVIWSVSDETVASITSEGLLVAKSNGTVTVYATATDGSEVVGSKLMGVSGVLVEASSLAIIGGDISDGKPNQYSVSLMPANATTTDVVWSISDETIAQVSQEGLLTPLTNGVVTLRATLDANPSIFAELVINITGVVEQGEAFAFPGAEGFGRITTGGRGGRVVYVTNLNDSGSGSLRDAVEQTGARYILFKTSGTIQLQSNLTIRNGNVTIAGQTAPGDGITIRDYSVVVNTSNVIIRFMRFRMGDAAANEGDALGGTNDENIIVDHCSMSWSTDECVSFYGNKNFTLQWCFITESLNNSVHEKGAHGYGGIWGGERASFHHNLLAHHNSRNPRFGLGDGLSTGENELVDLRNNVIYNWGSNSAYGAEGMNVNIVNCYYKPGPVTSKVERIIAIDKGDDPSAAVFDQWGTFYIDGNFMEGSANATADNWTYGVYNQFHSKYGTVSNEDKAAMRLISPLDIENNVVTHTAQQAYEKVLAYAGASLVRDAVDLRIASEVTNGTFTYSGSKGSNNGIIDSHTDVGGWPALNSAQAPLDTSGDGMPDNWKISQGLDPTKVETNGRDLHVGYDNIEIYLASLVDEIVNAQN